MRRIAASARAPARSIPVAETGSANAPESAARCNPGTAALPSRHRYWSSGPERRNSHTPPRRALVSWGAPFVSTGTSRARDPVSLALTRLHALDGTFQAERERPPAGEDLVTGGRLPAVGTDGRGLLVLLRFPLHRAD